MDIFYHEYIWIYLSRNLDHRNCDKTQYVTTYLQKTNHTRECLG